MSINEIWQKYKETDKLEYKQYLIEEYSYLLKIVAGRLYNYYGGNVEFDDLLGFGAFGLIDAVEKFEPERNLKFETYAQIRIRGSIIDSLRKIDWIPRSLRKKSKDFEQAIKKVENRTNRTATPEEVAKELGITEEEVNKTFNEISTFNMVSLEEVIANHGNVKTREKGSDTPEDSYEKKEIKEILLEVLKTLTEKEQMVISLYYFEELTYKEIGEVLELSESRISQIHGKCLSTIKARLSKLGITDYV